MPPAELPFEPGGTMLRNVFWELTRLPLGLEPSPPLPAASSLTGELWPQAATIISNSEAQAPRRTKLERLMTSPIDANTAMRRFMRITINLALRDRKSTRLNSSH